MDIVKLHQIDKSFSNTKILNNFSLNINYGDKILLFGKSGIGKSTIFKLILGFIVPDNGKVYYKNEELNEKNIWELRYNTAYIPQSVDIGEGKTINFVKHIMSYKVNKDKNFNDEEIIELLDYFNLSRDILFKDLRTLSGGEKQRIAIIISILLKRSIFLLDEITAQLDKELKKKVAEHFTNIDETVIVISHDNHWIDNGKMKVINLENNGSN